MPTRATGIDFGPLDQFDGRGDRTVVVNGQFDAPKANLIFTPGAKKLCTCLKRDLMNWHREQRQVRVTAGH